MSLLTNSRIKNKNDTSGFTIIEVLIVLAIAGFILSMIFIAIPTLQRNSRNSQKKQDVAAILAAVSNYELNNSGDFPPQPTDANNDFLLNTKLTYYTKTYDASTGIKVIAVVNPDNAVPLDPVTDPQIVEVHNRQKCDAVNQGKGTNQGAGYNDVVALFALDTGNGATTSQCQQL